MDLNHLTRHRPVTGRRFSADDTSPFTRTFMPGRPDNRLPAAHAQSGGAGNRTRVRRVSAFALYHAYQVFATGGFYPQTTLGGSRLVLWPKLRLPLGQSGLPGSSSPLAGAPGRAPGRDGSRYAAAALTRSPVTGLMCPATTSSFCSLADDACPPG